MQRDRIDGRPPTHAERFSGERSSRRALRDLARLGLALSLLLAATSTAAFDSERRGECLTSSIPVSPSVSADGFRCETRHLAREVGFRNFVIDRVTECRPLRSFSPGGAWPTPREADAARAEAEAEAAVERAAAAGGPPSADRVARWTRDRVRLANAQYDRSLRGIAGGFVRAAR